MGAAWSVADRTLFAILSAWLSSLRPSSWYVLDLYTNNHTPAPGDEAGNYTIPTSAQWSGYVGVKLPAADWSRPSVAADVAQTYQPSTVVFTYPAGIGTFTVYGYLVTEGLGNLVWAEEFAAPIVPVFPGGISIQPYFNLGILPAPGFDLLEGAEQLGDNQVDDGFEE